MMTPLGEAADGSEPGGDPGASGPGGGDPFTGRAVISPAGARAKPVLSRDALDLESATVLDALPVRAGIGTTAVAARAGLDPVTVVRCLGALAAAGFAERCAGGWRVRRS
jgi:hypothetical protein